LESILHFARAEGELMLPEETFSELWREAALGFD